MIILVLLATIYLLIGVVLYILDGLSYGRLWPDVEPVYIIFIWPLIITVELLKYFKKY